MTRRTLPAINAFQQPQGVDWECPIEARERFEPLAAADADERTLTIAGPIGETYDDTGITANYVRGFLRRVGSGDITVALNSPGGSFFEGLAIYNMLREFDGEVTVNVLGIAASAASVIAMASDELRVAKAGFLMIHNAWSLVIGNRHDLKDVMELLAKFDESMARVYADRSGMDQKKIAGYMDKETFFTGEEAVELGLADGLLSSDKVTSAQESPEARADRAIELALARQNVPRPERRALLSRLKGSAPGAAVTTAPGAGDNAALRELRGLIEDMNTR